MKKKAVTVTLALLTAAALAVPVLATCLDCYLVYVPDPDGGPSSPEAVCLDLAVPTGWNDCEEQGRGCNVVGFCWNSTGGGPPEK